MKTAIRWNFREFVHGAIDEYLVDYLSIRGFEEAGKISVSAFCVTRDAVRNAQALVKNSGLKVTTIEPNATALLAAFDHNIKWTPGEYYVVLDLGDTISNFIVVGNECLLFSRPLTNLYCKKLVELVSKKLTLDENKAREILLNYTGKSNILGGIDERNLNEDEAKVGKVVSHFISDIVVDVQRSIDAFCLMYHRDKVDKIYLCGGGVYLPNVVERFSSGLGVEVELFNPFTKILDAEDAMTSKEAPMYAVAVGLAVPKE